MTDSFNRKAGEYFLTSFKLYNFNAPDKFINIAPLIHSWSLVESMDASYIHGSARVYDSVGLLDGFIGEEKGWLRGEEEIEVSYTDFFDTTLTEQYFVYAIDNLATVKKSNESFYQYDIHFVSKEKFTSENITVQRGYNNGLISDYVQQVFDEFYRSNKPISIQSTVGYQNLVVPSYNPDQTMQFFARKAYSGPNTPSTFRFFENREGYHFKTIEELILDFRWDLDGQLEGSTVSQLPTFKKIEDQDQTPEGQVRLMSSFLELEFPTYVNTIKDMTDGGYYRTTKELDFLNRTITLNEYRYLDEYQKYTHPDNQLRSKHSKAFVDAHMTNSADYLVIKDYSENATSPFMRKDTHYPNAYNEKNANLYHHLNELVKLKVYGRNTINAGDLVYLDLDEVNFAVGDRAPDRKRSGYYIIETAESIFAEDQYYQVLHISKSGFNEKPEAASNYIRQTENSGEALSDTTVLPRQSGSNWQPAANAQSREDMHQYALDAGFSEEEARIMTAIAIAESSGNASALNDNAATGDLSYGLWQINMIGAIGPERVGQLGLNSYEDLYNPATNARAAKSVYDSQGFNAWSVYRNGSYRKYL